MAAAVCEWPASGKPDLEWVQSLAEAMLAASQARGGGSLCKTRGLAARVPYATAEALLSEAASALAKDATVVDVEGYDVDEVIVVGDTHGQFHDVLRLIELSGPPGAGFAGADARECASARLAADSTQRMRVEGADAGEAAVPAANAVDTEAAVAADMDATSDSSSDDEVTINPRRRANPQQQERHAGGGEKEQDQLGADEGQASAAPIPVRKKTRTIVFNGDFVDRGAWSVETLLLLCAYRLAAPGRAVLLRGNHESKFCTMCYGFNTELEAKYGSDAKALYRRCLRVFSNLPLAALVAGKALVLHGGLFRAPPKKSKKAGGKGGRSKRHYAVQLGTVDELRRASRGGQDPDGEGVRAVASDVLWSDPTMDEGLEENDNRGIGLLYGPDATKQFLKVSTLGRLGPTLARARACDRARAPYARLDPPADRPPPLESTHRKTTSNWCCARTRGRMRVPTAWRTA